MYQEQKWNQAMRYAGHIINALQNWDYEHQLKTPNFDGEFWPVSFFEWTREYTRVTGITR